MVLNVRELGGQTIFGHFFVPSGHNDLLVDLHGVCLATVDKLHASRYDLIARSLVVEEDACGESLRQDLSGWYVRRRAIDRRPRHAP